MRVDIVGAEDLYLWSSPNLQGTFWSSAFSVSIIVPNIKPPSVETKGFLTDGDLNAVGERACTNYQLKGEAFALPTVDWVDEVTPMRIIEDGPVVASSVKHTYRTNPRTYASVTGPVYFNGVPNYLRWAYPDLLTPVKSGGWIYRNAQRVFQHRGGGIYRYELSIETSSYPYKVWTKRVSTFDYEIDFEGKRSRQYLSTRWYPFTKIYRETFSGTSYHVGSLPVRFDDWKQITSRLARQYVLPNPTAVYGDLVRRCANDAKVIPTNSIELIAELANIVNSVKAVAELTQGRIDANKIASGWLSYKYGLRLTYHDLQTVRDGVLRKIGEVDAQTRRTRARETFSIPSWDVRKGHLDIIYNYKIFHAKHSDDWRDGVRTWFDSGLFPSLTNAWDLIPLSFVMDWFAHIESYLDAADANTYWSLYRIKGVTYSEKRIYHDVGWLFSDAGFTLSGQIDAVIYDRQLRSTVHKPQFFDSTPQDFRNYAEFTSLFVLGLGQ